MVFGPVLCFAFWAELRNASQDRKAAFASVEAGMKLSYNWLGMDVHANSGASEPVFKTNEIQAAFLNRETSELRFSSFLRPEYISTSAKPVEWKTTNLLCAVTFYKKLHGLDANGIFREISWAEFTNWPHIPLPVRVK